MYGGDVDHGSKQDEEEEGGADKEAVQWLLDQVCVNLCCSYWMVVLE